MKIIKVNLYSLEDGWLMYADGEFKNFYCQETPNILDLEVYFESNPIQILLFTLKSSFDKYFVEDLNMDAPTETDLQEWIE